MSFGHNLVKCLQFVFLSKWTECELLVAAQVTLLVIVKFVSWKLFVFDAIETAPSGLWCSRFDWSAVSCGKANDV